MELRGRWALVTGAAKRVGRSIALALAERGANVVVHYHTSTAAAAETVGALEALGVQAFALGGDLSRSTEVERLAGEAEARPGGLAVLVNSAANYPRVPLAHPAQRRGDTRLSTN